VTTDRSDPTSLATGGPGPSRLVGYLGRLVVDPGDAIELKVSAVDRSATAQLVMMAPTTRMARWPRISWSRPFRLRSSGRRDRRATTNTAPHR
jgi:hypothetical protein